MSRKGVIHVRSILLQHTTTTCYCNTLVEAEKQVMIVNTSAHVLTFTATHNCTTLMQRTTATHHCNTPLRISTATHCQITLTQQTTAMHYFNTRPQHTTAGVEECAHCQGEQGYTCACAATRVHVVLHVCMCCYTCACGATRVYVLL